MFGLCFKRLPCNGLSSSCTLDCEYVLHSRYHVLHAAGCISATSHKIHMQGRTRGPAAQCRNEAKTQESHIIGAISIFFGYKRDYSLTQIQCELELPDFDRFLYC